MSQNDIYQSPEESQKDQRTPMEKLADEAAKVAVQQMDTGLKSRKGRFDEIQKNEDVVAGVKTKALRGRNNVPFDTVLARGYLDTLESKIKEGLEIGFERAPGRQQDKKAAMKLTAAVDHLRGPDQGQWDMHDLGSKKLAIGSGRGILKKFSSRDASGKFCDHFEVVDHWDFYTEPMGGGFLDRHLFKGQFNIFRTIEELRASAVYNKRQVAKLIRHGNDSSEDKSNEEELEKKVSRATALGIDFDTNKYVGSKIFSLVEHVMFWRGKWYHIVFHKKSGIWLRFEELEKVFSIAKHYPGRGAWLSWATHFDPFVFWSLAPMDSIRPIAAAVKKVMNLSLDNLEKRNWGQRAYDPNVFNPRDLLWKHDGLVKANIRTQEQIANKVYTFETPDTTQITINLVEWMDSYLGTQTGITSGAKGKGDQQKVGIYMGDMQQVADRLGLTNKMYEQCHVDIGVNAQWGLFDHMSEEYAVNIIGNTGVEWNETLKREDINRKFSIRVTGSDFEDKMNVALGTRKTNSLLMVQNSPTLQRQVNPKWYLREVLTLGGYDQEQVRIASDAQSDADDDQLSDAAQAIEDIIEGVKPRMYRNATTGFIKKIMDFAYDTDLEISLFKKLVGYAQEHIPLARANMERQVIKVQVAASMAQIGTPGAGGGAPATTPAPVNGGPAAPAINAGAGGGGGTTYP